MDALVSVVRKMQTQEVITDVEQAEEQLVILRNRKKEITMKIEADTVECAKQETTHKGIKSQIGSCSTMNEMLATIRKNNWREMTDKLDPRLRADWVELNRQRNEIREANPLSQDPANLRYHYDDIYAR
jgi:hypothetical protein